MRGKVVFLLACAASVALSLLSAPSSAGAGRPNLLIVHTDEHNFRTLGCYRATLPPEQALMWGDAVVETPHVDWLAQRGALCTSFYATTPVCSPSRAALVTGRYPQNTPVTTNDVPLSDDVVTFAEILRRQGYATGYAGKWHLDGGGKPQWAPGRKFGFEDNRYMFNRGHWKQLEDTPDGPRVKARSPAGQPNYNVAGADEQSFTTDFLAQKTVEFIDAHKEGPFCYMVSLPDPHGPDTVRPPYDTMFQHQTYQIPRTFDKPDGNLPSWGAKAGGFAGMASYYGMVKCIDDNVGKILAALRSNGLMENTIVVFTADHGDLRGEHHRQNKGVPYEGSAKIPLIVYYPEKIEAGAVIDEAMGCVDFLPTILGLMGVETAGKEQGRDASALLTTGKAPAGWKDVTFLRSTGRNGEGWLAAVSDRSKLIYSSADDPWLFDLENDPDELINRFSDPAYRETVRELSREIVAYGKKYDDPRVENAKIKADLQWAVEGTGQYVPTPPTKRPAASAPGGKKAAGQGRRRNRA
ncbi:MAG TPA: sulfatase [Thermoguttaceae bacterium]|nr:sulfatase [Thermoguttaceae bacterium]